MKEDYKFLWLNLVEFMVYYDRPDVCNTVVAIGHRDKGVLIMRPEFKDIQQDIVEIAKQGCPHTPFVVRYGDGFRVDTWDNKIRDFVDNNDPVKEAQEDEEEHYLMTYWCRECDETWSQTHSCACNDKCPKCNKEYEPLYIEEV